MGGDCRSSLRERALITGRAKLPLSRFRSACRMGNPARPAHEASNIKTVRVAGSAAKPMALTCTRVTRQPSGPSAKPSDPATPPVARSGHRCHPPPDSPHFAGWRRSAARWYLGDGQLDYRSKGWTDDGQLV